MVIVNYISKDNVSVEFLDSEYVTTTSYQAFKKGLVKNPYDKSVYGVGYFGEGKYRSIDENNQYTKCYKTWHKIHERCYSEDYKLNNPSYRGCSVDERWHNYQTFAKWYDENYYTIEGQRMDLDKDILVKGNRVYSSETCLFVPQFINTLFTKSNSKRGMHPIGVHKVGSKYISTCLDGKKNKVRLGSFLTPEEAFSSYKEYKENVIKEAAKDIKEKIPPSLYKALMVYEVEIDD